MITYDYARASASDSDGTCTHYSPIVKAFNFLFSCHPKNYYKLSLRVTFSDTFDNL